MSLRVAYVGPATSIDEAFDRFRRHPGDIACDTETVSVTDKRIIGIGFAISAVEALYVAAFDDDENSQHAVSPYLPKALELLFDDHIKVWFNAYFDLEVLEKYRATIDQINWHDVSIMCRVQAMHNSLEMNAGEYLGMNHQVISDILPKDAKGKASGNMLKVPFGTTAWKCMNDCMVTWRLWSMIDGRRWLGEHIGYNWKDVKDNTYDVTPEMIKAYQLDRKLIPLLRKMGKKGLKLDIAWMRSKYEQLAKEKFVYEDICKRGGADFVPFSPGSNQQTGYVLASRGNYLPWTKNGQWKQFAVGADELSVLDDPLAHVILEYRKRADQMSDIFEPLLGKPKGTAGKKVPYSEWEAAERFTTHFRLDLATSRLASYDRNAQNITPALRSIFDPDNGEFTWWDASQIEMRIFAYLSQDPVLLQAYRDDISVHMMTMEQLFPGQPKIFPDGTENPLYTTSKTFNFAMIYNAKATTLAQHTKRPVEVCGPLRERWLAKYARAAEYMVEAEEDGIWRGWVPTLEGRRLRIPDITVRGEEHSRTCCINYRVQGSASWPIKVALLDGEERGFDQRIQVHDEVVIDGAVKEEVPTEYYRHLMGDLETPVAVYSGKKWA